MSTQYQRALYIERGYLAVICKWANKKEHAQPSYQHQKYSSLRQIFAPPPSLMPCWQGLDALFEQLLLNQSPNLDSNKKPQKVLECSCVDFCLLCSTITSWVVALTVTLGSCKVRPPEFLAPQFCAKCDQHLVNVSKCDQKLGQCVKVWPKKF